MIQKTQQRHCILAATSYTLTRQTYFVSGLGDEHTGIQRDYSCSNEQQCAHSHHKDCPRQQIQKLSDERLK